MHRLNLACLSVLALGLVCFNLYAGSPPSRTERQLGPLTPMVRDKAQVAKALDAMRLAASTPTERIATDARKPATRRDAAKDVVKRRAEAKKRATQRAQRKAKPRNASKNRARTKDKKAPKKAKNSRKNRPKAEAVKKRTPRKPAPPLPQPSYTPLEAALMESLTLEVVDLGPYKRWRVSIHNRGNEPRRVAADSRLLSFEATVPGKSRPVQCELPPSMLPNHKRVPYVYLRPGQTHTFRVDPRMYCFATGDQTTLVPGAFLKPRYGWPEKTKTRWSWGRRYEERLTQSAPFVAVVPPSHRNRGGHDGFGPDEEQPSEASSSKARPSSEAQPPQAPPSDAQRAPMPPPVMEEGYEIASRVDEGLKQLQSEGFALRSEYKGWSRARLPKDDLGDRPGKDLQLAITYGSDAPNPRDVTVKVELKNLSDETRRVYFRSDLVAFRVRGPDGTTECEPIGVERRAPDPQAFTNIRAGKAASFTVRLLEFCPAESFARPGFYYVSAVLPATARGSLPDEDVFTGRLATSAPRPVRLHQAELPFLIRRRSEAMSRVGSASARTPIGRTNPQPAQMSATPAPAQAPVPPPPPPPAPPPPPQPR